MSNKARRKRHKAEPDSPKESRRLFTTLVVAVLVLMMVAAFAVTCRKNFSTPVSSAYEGQIVDKWRGTTESETGSFPYYRLLIEQSGGSRITVPIDYDTYTRLNIGMWIKFENGKIDVSVRPEGSPSRH